MRRKGPTMAGTTLREPLRDPPTAGAMIGENGQIVAEEGGTPAFKPGSYFFGCV